MDVPAAAAGPWIALGAVLGILLLLVAGAIALRLRARTSSSPSPALPPPPVAPRDDLASFLARPPGTPGAADDDGDGWAVLAPAAPRPAEPGGFPAAPGAPGPGTVLAALAVAALLLLGAAAALAVAARSPEPVPAAAEPPAPPPAPAPATPSGEPGTGDGVAARLVFAGVVLEEHAVGITAAYPELELASTDGRTVARLRLPATNCLAATAPPQPGDPSCRTARTEYAELSTPDLRVVRDGDEITVSGRFDTSLRPPGGNAEPTGRSYDVTVTVAPDGSERDGWLPVSGRMEWDDQVALTRTGEPASVLRSES